PAVLGYPGPRRRCPGEPGARATGLLPKTPALALGVRPARRVSPQRLPDPSYETGYHVTRPGGERRPVLRPGRVRRATRPGGPWAGRPVRADGPAGRRPGVPRRLPRPRHVGRAGRRGPLPRPGRPARAAVPRPPVEPDPAAAAAGARRGRLPRVVRHRRPARPAAAPAAPAGRPVRLGPARGRA